VRLRDKLSSGRATTLPFWFSGMNRCAVPVQSADMDFSAPGAKVGFGTISFGPRWTPSVLRPSWLLPRAFVTYFAEESPGPENEMPHAGPVLVMPPAKKPNRPHRWLHRLWLVVFVLFCLEVGIILTVLPWTKLWTENSLLLSYPAVHDFLMLGFVRGVVSGLGLVDIWMGVAEAVTYRENPRS
jgi:hypothetical protein